MHLKVPITNQLNLIVLPCCTGSLACPDMTSQSSASNCINCMIKLRWPGWPSFRLPVLPLETAKSMVRGEHMIRLFLHVAPETG